MDGYPDDACPFCSLDADRIIEADTFAVVISDAFPVSPGHTLIIPRRHVADPFELLVPEIRSICRLIRLSRKRLDAECSPQGYNIGINAGKVAGQTIMHVHVHLIPRYAGDLADPTGGIRNVIPGKGRYGMESVLP